MLMHNYTNGANFVASRYVVMYCVLSVEEICGRKSQNKDLIL